MSGVWDSCACRDLRNMWHRVFEVTLPNSLNCCLNPVWFTNEGLPPNAINFYINDMCITAMQALYHVNTVQKSGKQLGRRQHPSWLWNVMLCKLCFWWKRCKLRKLCPVRRSTHAGASGGGGDGVPFAERKKRFAGQQGLRSQGLSPRDLVLDEIYHLSCYHFSALKLKTGLSSRPRLKLKCSSGPAENLKCRLPVKQMASPHCNHCMVQVNCRDQVLRIQQTSKNMGHGSLSQLLSSRRIWLADHFTRDSPGCFCGLVEGNLEVKLPTIWTDEKQSRAEAKRRERLEERRSEEKEPEERRCRCAKR